MTRVAISRTALGAAGLNLTDATYTTLSTGAGNGVEVPYREGDVLILRNDTAGAAVYTVKVVQPSAYSGQGLTIPDETFSVAAAKSWAIALETIYKQTDGDVYVDCDVAGKVLMLGAGDT